MYQKTWQLDLRNFNFYGHPNELTTLLDGVTSINAVFLLLDDENTTAKKSNPHERTLDAALVKSTFVM